MTTLVIAEMIIALIGGLAFVGLYGARSDWRATEMGRHIMLFMLVMTVEVGSLLSLAVWRVPVWVFAVIFAALDAVVLQRLWLLWRAQREE